MPLLNKLHYLKKDNAIKSCQELDSHDIEKIFSGELLGLRIQNFYPKSECEKVVFRLLNNNKLEPYAVARHILKIGKAIFDASDSPDELKKYYEVALTNLKETRDFYSPSISPIDLLRITLQEVWPSGSNLENFHGNTVYCGLTRLFKPGSEALPHQDMAHWDIPDSLAAWSQKTQLAANIYLKTAAKGGDLELWSNGFQNKYDYEKNSLPNTYGLDRKKIASSSVVISPDQGDLIIFDARRIHAVQRIYDGSRLTSSCFIGYRGVTQPLAIFS